MTVVIGCGFVHDKQVVESSAEGFESGWVVVITRAVEFGVVANDGNDVDRIESLAQHRKQLKTDGHKRAMPSVVGVGFVGITHIQPHESARTKHTVDLADDPIHRAVIVQNMV